MQDVVCEIRAVLGLVSTPGSGLQGRIFQHDPFLMHHWSLTFTIGCLRKLRNSRNKVIFLLPVLYFYKVNITKKCFAGAFQHSKHNAQGMQLKSLAKAAESLYFKIRMTLVKTLDQVLATCRDVHSSGKSAPKWFGQLLRQPSSHHAQRERGRL